MKTIFSLVLALFLMLSVTLAQTSQHCTTETFSGSEAGWTYSQGAHVGKYDNPLNSCVEDRGIITPGVGGNNPCNIMTNEFISTGANRIDLTFDIIVLDANLRCNSWKNYDCETSVDVFYYAGGQKHTGVINHPLPPNGPGNPSMVTLSFNAGMMLPAGTHYKIEFCFKPKSGLGNCVQQNTKYVFDNFRSCETVTPRTDINERTTSTTPQNIQSCTTENFSGEGSGWTYSQGAHVGSYTNPANSCVDDRGIITPGVGGNNPCNIRTNQFISTGANRIDLTFDIIVLDANLRCNSWKNYDCETSIDVFYYIGRARYTGVIDQLLPPNGPSNPTMVSVSFSAGDNLPAGTAYSIELCFKPKSGTGNCVQQNTKYIFDNFRNCETVTPRTDINERTISTTPQNIQSCTTENFTGEGSGWTYSQGAHVGSYTNPANSCVDDRGIITPGVGGNNPCNIRTNEFISTGANRIDLTFDMIVLNANLRCNSWKDYDCVTSVDVFYYVGANRYTAVIDQQLPPNGPQNPTMISVTFNTGDNLPAGTVYSIEMCFKPKSGIGSCVQQNTKYVFDNFRNCETVTSRIDINERQQNSTVQLESTPSRFNVYPNPTRGATKITVNGEAGIQSMSLVDANGKVLQSVTGTSFIMFSVKNLKNGKYYVQFEKSNGDQFRKQLIINK